MLGCGSSELDGRALGPYANWWVAVSMAEIASSKTTREDWKMRVAVN